ncbi:MAG: DNA mismatch repair protein MutS [Bdellovibrionales bacterium]
MAKQQKLTPLMQQYWAIKNLHKDKILLFRMGDFYEIFADDAMLAAPILGIALTVRNKKSGDTTKMCGFPHHSVSGPINKLLKQGLKVAICDQIEDPSEAKGLVKRAVTQILSPGMIYDPETLDGAETNYIAFCRDLEMSVIDTSTGENIFFKFNSLEEQNSTLQLLGVKELVLTKKDRLQWLNQKKDLSGPHLTELYFEDSDLEYVVSRGFNSSPKVVLDLLCHLHHMSGDSLFSHLRDLKETSLSDSMELSYQSLRHLEIFENQYGEKNSSVFHAIDSCSTSSGRRLLKSYLNFPSVNLETILLRQDKILYWREFLSLNPLEFDELKTLFKELGDIERRLAKISGSNHCPRDLQSLTETLEAGLRICSKLDGEWVSAKNVIKVDELVSRSRSTLVDDVPLKTKKANIIQRGVNGELDEYFELTENSQEALNQLEQDLKAKYQIGSLKIRYNNVFGYYIEVTNAHRDKVPEYFMRKQTLTNSERYTTEELQNLERKILGAKSRKEELEEEIYLDLRTFFLNNNSYILSLSQQLAELDVFTSHAKFSLENNYVRPTLSEKGPFDYELLRHPIVEKKLGNNFVANSFRMEKPECHLITGPNMAGKSTYMKQIAVACILAQSGLNVPASKSHQPLVDSIYSRIGASDQLSEGNSTFMVEMLETAEILNSKAKRPLILLDEIGRGTSTYDGLSLAQSILEYIAKKNHSFCLFSSHYHELTELSGKHTNIRNYHMTIQENNGRVQFLHTVKEGAANKSYGIHVAELAGLPKIVISRAKKILKEMELQSTGQFSLLKFAENDFDELKDEGGEEISADPEKDRLLSELSSMEVASLTPLAALIKIEEWQKRLS